MSVSLYYMAKREEPLSPQEQSAYEKVVDRYVTEYDLGELYEPFCVYDAASPSEAGVIFEGATKLPLDEGEEHFAEVFNYWTDCLQEVIHLLPHAQWNIHIDDVDITTHFDYPT